MNTSLNSSWYYTENGERKGPVPFSNLHSLLQQGLAPSTLVWSEGMEQWIPASSIPELISVGPTSPYSAPGTEVLPTESHTGNELNIPQQPIPLDLGFCIGQGWKFTLANFGQIFLFGLSYFLISFAVSAVLGGISMAVDGLPQTLQGPDGQIEVTQSGGAVTTILNLVDNVVSIFLSLGAVRYGHLLLNGENPPISELFSQGSKLLSFIGATILYGIMIGVGLLLLIVPGIIVIVRFGFYQQAIVEKNLGAIDALKYSLELTKTNGLSLFGLYILSFLIVLAGLLAVIVGLLWAIPTTWLALLIAFRYLHNGKNAVKVLP
jgi:hypothetical protein